MSELWREQVTRDRDPELEEINRLALARIKEMEQEIASKYHMHLRMGTETESLFVDEAGNTVVGPPGDINREEYQCDPSVISASLWERVYVDTKGAFEFVTGYRIPEAKEVKKNQRNGADAKKRAMDKEGYYRQPSYQANLVDKLRMSLAAKRFAGMSLDGDAHISFAAQRNTHHKKHVSLAFQPNISVWDDKKNLFFYSSLFSLLHDSPFAIACAQGTNQVQRETVLLAANYPESYDQFYEGVNKECRRGIGATHETDIDLMFDCSAVLRGRGRAELKRIENRLPRADSNPILAVLQSVAGIYHTLETQTKIVQQPTARDGNFTYIELGSGLWLQVNKKAELDNPLENSVGDHEKNHKIFAESALAKHLLGEKLHAKVASYFSRQAIAERQRQQAIQP